MSLAFRNVTSAPLDNLDVVAPDGTVVGIVGENGSGKSLLLRLAAGLETPASGSVKASGGVRWLGPDDALNLASAPVPLIEPTFGHQHPLVRDRRGGPPAPAPPDPGASKSPLPPTAAPPTKSWRPIRSPSPQTCARGVKASP